MKSYGPGLLFAGLVLIFGCGAEQEAGSPSMEDSGSPGSEAPLASIPGDPKLLLTPGSVMSLLRPDARSPWEPNVDSTRFRGGGAKIFEHVAPAVVVVRNESSHGSGFLISDSGLVLTNNHVVADDAFVDPEQPASYSDIYFGAIQDGRIKRIESPVRGYVLAVDSTRDLALLQLAEIPEALQPLNYLELAESGPRPGDACAIVGHPSSGLLWSFRRGEVSALGVYPDDLVNLVLAMLASTQTDRERLAAQLAFMDSMEIVLSSCQVNRGDSGGPLVNDDGEVVGVTFGIPGDYLDQKVAYHVSLAEVQAFLENAEHEKLLLLPDGWQLKPVLMLAEPKLLAAGDDAATPTQFLFDLDEDTPPGLLDLRNPIELVGRRRFDAEVILHYSERRRLAFYDTDDDREFDVILLDNDTDPSADRQYTRVEDGTWQVEEGADRPWFDPSLLKQRRLKKTFVELVEKYDLG